MGYCNGLVVVVENNVISGEKNVISGEIKVGFLRRNLKKYSAFWHH